MVNRHRVLSLMSWMGSLAGFSLLVSMSVRAQGSVLYVAPGGDCGGVSPSYATVQAAVDAATAEAVVEVASAVDTGVGVLSRMDFTTNGLDIDSGAAARFLHTTIARNNGARWAVEDAHRPPASGAFALERQDLEAVNELQGLLSYTDLPKRIQSEEAASAIGFIHYDGTVVEGAVVAITGPSGTFTTTTQLGPLNDDPYFTAPLSAPPLNAFPDELLKMRFSYSGQENTSAFRVVPGDQELHGYLSSTCGPTEIYGPSIATNTSWSAECGPYRIHQNLMIESTGALTIGAGTTVEFDPGRALVAEGDLFTDGAYNELVAFTSPTPSAGEWSYLQINNAAVLSGTLVEYGGGTELEHAAAVRVDGGAAVFDNLCVHHSDSDGIQVYGNGDVQMNDLLITDNAGWGIVENSSSLNMEIYNSTVQNNGDGGIWIELAGIAEIYSNLICDNLGSGIYIEESGIYTNIAGNILCRNEAYRGGGILMWYSDGIIENNLIWDNQADTRGGGISTFSAAPEIRNNFILDNSATGDRGGGLFLRQGSDQHSVNNNLIVGNTAVTTGGGIYSSPAGNQSVHSNSILYNQAGGQGGAIYVDYPDVNNTIITTNTILFNTASAGQGAVQLTATSHPIYDNNIFGNSDYSLFYGSPYDPDGVQNAEQNWWGTDLVGEIAALIWDWSDDPDLAVVDYNPYLTAPSIVAPVIPPQDFIAAKDGFTITLSWSPNLETDLGGYKLYFGPSEDLEIDAILGLVPAADLGMSTQVTITDVPVGVYSMAVTAYDFVADGDDDWRQGHESWFSPVERLAIGESPQAGFYAQPLSGNLPLTVAFTDTSSGDFDSWLWDFGDGGASTEQHPSHTYTSAGTYTVTLTVSGLGDSDTLTRSNYITVYESVHAAFTGDPTSGIAPLLVTFANESTGDVATCAWTFGDGATSGDCSDPSHTYIKPGAYTVGLTVSGPSGSDTLTRPGYITVEGHRIYLPLVVRNTP